MKANLRLFSLIAAMVLPIAIWANVIVKGHVTYQNGQVANNYAVHIETDSNNTVCKASHIKYTNPNGIYQDTLICSGKIEHVLVWVVDCHNNMVSNYLPITTSGVVEVNFVVCSNGQCNADFTWYAISNTVNTIRFHSETSTASLSDSIISRKWIYGDGDSAVGNSIAPDHHYANAGNYTVCLYIKTKSGCESHICKPISIIALHTCHAGFISYEIIPQTTVTGYTLRFHDTAITATSSDSIITRTWTFGDGSTLGGNIPNPAHTYTKPGNYTVCLTIVSKSGCTDSTCQTILVPPPIKCHAQFTYLPAANATNIAGYIHFNGQPSTTGTGDSITQYHWIFGDGGTASTKDPVHTYTKPGNYTVCLTIVSKSGCTDSTCQIIVVPPIKCHAQFTYLPVANTTNTPGYIHFNGQPSTTGTGDSITQYHWTFGDGGTASTKDPYHTYTKAGSYLACLTIICKSGCIDSTCVNIIVAAPPPTTCSANFNFTDTGLIGHFYSIQINVSFGDSIISRDWTFGDGQTLAGNVVHHCIDIIPAVIIRHA